MTPNPLRCLKQQLETYLHIAHTWQKILSPAAQELIKIKVTEYKTLLVIIEKALERHQSDQPSNSNPASSTTLNNHKKLRSFY